MDHTRALAQEGGQTVSVIFITEVLDNKAGTLGNCSLANVCLLLSAMDLTGMDFKKCEQISQ